LISFLSKSESFVDLRLNANYAWPGVSVTIAHYSSVSAYH